VLRTFAAEFTSSEPLPMTRFNAIVSPYRVFETRRFRLDDFRRIRRLARGATVNDAIIAVCAGGLRRYLAASHELPELDLVALTPFYVRDPAAGKSKAAEVAWGRLQLGVNEADPLARLRLVRDQHAASPLVQRAIDARDLTDLANYAPAATLALTGKMLGSVLRESRSERPVANCAITNVPGPSTALYLDGARMTFFSAILPIDDGTGVVFAVTSYDGKVMISPTSCREQMPDPEFFAACIREAFEEYRALAPRPRSRSRVTPLSMRARKRGAGAAGAGAARPAARRAPSVPPAAPGDRRRPRARKH
jgi:WS/DGAT/MGAT family acyltransferase